MASQLSPPGLERISPGAIRCLCLAAGVTLTAGSTLHCGPSIIAPEPVAPAYEPVGQSKCSVSKSQLRPLVVEWPAADRAALEARARKGIVPVRYSGCDMEVLTRCTVRGSYAYTATTPKRDGLRIRNADELYANVPIYAAKLEAKLAQSGELDVSMSIVGRYEAEPTALAQPRLDGDCSRATHLVVAYVVGAFELAAGAATEAGAEASVLSAGGGVKGAAARETLSQDGSAAACERASSSDSGPPDGCGALVRIEVMPFEPKAALRAADSPGEAARASMPPASSTGTANATGAPPSEAAAGRMVRIPQSTLRSADGKTVRVAPFEIDATEVTVAAYQACVEAGRCSPRSTATIARYSEHCNASSRTRLLHPMNCVDWSDASRFCAAQAKRLPTAPEWQVAASSGDDRPFPWGQEEPSAELLNACGQECSSRGLFRGSDGHNFTAPVGSFPFGRNGYGLFDMAGNVREWTQGEPLMKKGSPSIPLDPGAACSEKSAPCRMQQVRGGEFGSSMREELENDAYQWLRADYRDHHTGFRCARSLTE